MCLIYLWVMAAGAFASAGVAADDSALPERLRMCEERLQASDSEVESDFGVFLEWMQSEGVEREHMEQTYSFKNVSSVYGGVALRAGRDIKAGELLSTLPESLMLTRDAASPIGPALEALEEMEALLVLIMFERLSACGLLPPTPRNPWLRLWPKPSSLQYFSAEEVHALQDREMSYTRRYEGRVLRAAHADLLGRLFGGGGGSESEGEGDGGSQGGGKGGEDGGGGGVGGAAAPVMDPSPDALSTAL